MQGRPRWRRMLVGLAAALSLAAVGLWAADKKPPASDKLEPYKCGMVERLHVFGGIFLASQPTPEDFKLAKEGGIKKVINLREPNELDWDEAAVVKKLGMQYVNAPFRSPEGLTDEIFNTVRKHLNDREQHPVLLHCSSANRVGAIWLAHRVLDHKLSYEEALAEAKTVGLRLPAFADKAKDYITRMQQKK